MRKLRFCVVVLALVCIFAVGCDSVSDEIEFITNGGSTVMAVLASDGHAAEPEEPSREGYSFAGWFRDPDFETSFSFTEKISGKLTLYAKWDCLHASVSEQVLISPTCSAPGTMRTVCAVCNETIRDVELPTIAHTFTEWRQTKAPTCAEDGKRIEICSVCGRDGTLTEPLEKLGHDFVLSETIASTCTVYGEKKFDCSRCDETKSEELPLADHIFNDRRQTKAPTCAEDGKRIEICSVCGQDGTLTEPLEKLGHDFVLSETIASTCTVYGEKKFDCSRCDEKKSEELPLADHIFNDRRQTKAPTCTEDGKRIEICSVCGRDGTLTEPLGKLGHDFVLRETFPSTCMVQGEKKFDCSRCDEKKSEELPLADHIFNDRRQTKAPTCTEDGEQIEICSVCEQDGTLTEPLQKLGHDFVLCDIIESTCTVLGEKKFDCSRCDEKKSEELPLIDHTYTWVTTVEADCTHIGHQIQTCEMCQSVGPKTRELPVDGDNHLFTEWDVVVESTCKVEGLLQIKCGRCQKRGSTTQTIPRTDEHDFSIWIVLREPTCSETGDKISKCSVCGDMGPSAVVEKLPHTFLDWTVTKAPTCSEEGVETETCRFCPARGAVTRPVDKIAHTLTLQYVKQPTCTDKGTTYDECEICHVRVNPKPVAALGHDWSEAVVTRPSNCIEQGESATTCARCGDVETTQLPLDPDLHVQSAAVCGHHLCCSTVENHAEAACNLRSHYVCDGRTHAPAPCGVQGHTLCDGLDHSDICRVDDISEDAALKFELNFEFFGQRLVSIEGTAALPYFLELPMLAPSQDIIFELGGVDFTDQWQVFRCGPDEIFSFPNYVVTEEGKIYISPLSAYAFADCDGLLRYSVNGVPALVRVKSARQTLKLSDVRVFNPTGIGAPAASLTETEQETQVSINRTHRSALPEVRISGADGTVLANANLIAKFSNESIMPFRMLQTDSEGFLQIPYREDSIYNYMIEDWLADGLLRCNEGEIFFVCRVEERVREGDFLKLSAGDYNIRNLLSLEVEAFDSVILDQNRVANLNDMTVNPAGKFTFSFEIRHYETHEIIEISESYFEDQQLYVLYNTQYYTGELTFALTVDFIVRAESEGGAWKTETRSQKVFWEPSPY